MIVRSIESRVLQSLYGGKAIILLGARQVGKTTLTNALFRDLSDVLWLNGDESDVRALFADITSTRLKAIVGGAKVVVIDEAQRIPDIGLKLKLLTDQIQGIQLIATGSSSLSLAGQVNEPLTGRKREFRLYPISFAEMANHHGLLNEMRLLPHRLVYGYYPEVINSPGQERRLLRELSESYLYKDILALHEIKKSEQLTRLLRALAFQIGSQVSYSELGQLCGLDKKTVEKYMTLLEQTFVLVRLGSYARNLRNELKTSKKIYFVDIGIRNALIADFRPFEMRDDIGSLWENFLVIERLKHNEYAENYANPWFWRTGTQQEIDYVEERDGCLSAYEFKWNPAAKVKQPKSFQTAYPGSTFTVVHRENVSDFLL